MMSFNLERAAMKGRLVELEEQRKRLHLKIEGLCTAIRGGLNTALTPVAELQIPQVQSQMDDLTMAWVELQKLESDINRLARELR